MACASLGMSTHLLFHHCPLWASATMHRACWSLDAALLGTEQSPADSSSTTHPLSLKSEAAKWAAQATRRHPSLSTPPAHQSQQATPQHCNSLLARACPGAAPQACHKVVCFSVFLFVSIAPDGCTLCSMKPPAAASLHCLTQ